MERIDETHKASQIVSQEDFITRMPENVMTNILDRLPIRNAVGTSILSRNWRFKWTMLTQLIVDEYYDWKNIYRLLIHLKGPITKFVFHTTEFDVEDISHWIMFLSRKGIKEFTLFNYHETPLKLPTHLFSCLELKHLMLYNCYFHSVPSFCGFPNLLSLDLCMVTDIGNCVEFITKCPLLEILKITSFVPVGKVKLVEIAKLTNLKVLWLRWCILDNLAITSSTIFQLGCYLPKLQELTLDFKECTFVEEVGLRKWVCIAFPCLKTLTLSTIDFSGGFMLSFALEMIWGSPNLQTLRIEAFYFGVPAYCFPEVDNNLKLQLQSVDLYSFRGLENEVYLIKSLLACSPLLKTMRIGLNSSPMVGGAVGKLIFATKLVELRRASPIAEVKLKWF